MLRRSRLIIYSFTGFASKIGGFSTPRPRFAIIKRIVGAVQQLSRS
jgi:hypothetical protein